MATRPAVSPATNAIPDAICTCRAKPGIGICVMSAGAAGVRSRRTGAGPRNPTRWRSGPSRSGYRRVRGRMCWRYAAGSARPGRRRPRAQMPLAMTNAVPPPTAMLGGTGRHLRPLRPRSSSRRRRDASITRKPCPSPGARRASAIRRERRQRPRWRLVVSR